MYPLSNDLVLQREEYHRFLFKKNYITLYLINDTNPIRRKSFLPALTGFEAENSGKILILKIAWQCVPFTFSVNNSIIAGFFLILHYVYKLQEFVREVCFMDEKTAESLNTDTGAASKIIAAGIGILSASVLAYCGYKIINNQLTKTDYEPDPNKIIK